MKTTFAVAVPFALAVAVLAQEPARKRLTFEDTQRPISWVGNVPVARIAWDGKHVEIQRGKKTRWYDPATETDAEAQPEPEAPVDGAGDAAASRRYAARIHDGDVYLEPARDSVVGGSGRRGRGTRGGRGGRGAPGEDAVRATTDGATPGAKVEAHCNAAGAFASFVRGGDFVIVDVAKKEQWQVTNDGDKDRLHGVLDWVYQEEVYGRGDFQGHWWSPQGDLVAVLSLDEAPVREFTIVDHVPPGFLDKERSVRTEVANYPKVGDPNPVASLSIVDAAARRVVPVDLSGYPKDVLVMRVE